jgi:putative spermidine/putrescine transport system ATP-binding protein
MSIRAAVNDVSVRLGSVQALDTVSLTVEPGQFLALLGPSGSGKTTTLNVLAGFVKPDQGTVTFDGKDVTGVPPHRRDLGIVFQGYALFPHMTVAQNVEFPLRMRGIASAERRKRAQQSLELVGLGTQAGRMVGTLSGGQRQRVALARAVVFEPRVMLLDEPLAALDKQLRDSMQHELKALQRRLGVTTVAVTHDQVEALTMADEVAVLCDGRVEQLADPQELYLRPATTFVAKFLGEANLIPVDRGQLAGFGSLGAGQISGTAVIRPEHIGVSAHDPLDDERIAAAATIEEVTFQGARLRARARLRSNPQVELTIAQPSGPASELFRQGAAVHLVLDPSITHVIPDTGAREIGGANGTAPQSAKLEEDVV